MIRRGVIKPKTDAETSLATAGPRPRDPAGRFAQAPQVTQKPAGAPQTPQAAAAAIQALPLPKSIKREMEAHWKAAHPELQRALTEREAAYEKGLSSLQTHRQQAEAAAQLMAEFRPYEQVMRMTGTSPAAAVRQLMPVLAVLNTGSPQEKAFVAAKVLQQYGVPVEHIQQVLQGGVNGVQAQNGQPAGGMDPTVMEMRQQITALTNAFTANQQQSQAAETQRINAITDAFAKDKPNFDGLRPQMYSLILAQSQAAQQGLDGPFGPQSVVAAWTERDWVEKAYNAAIRLNPELYESELARQRDAAVRADRTQATQAAQASRAAAVQVRGAPAPAAAPGQLDPRDRRAVISAALRARA